MRQAIAWAVIALLVPAGASAGTVTINGNSYTYVDHPRIYLDGSAGTLTSAVKDPDGAGPLVAPKATDSEPAFVALKAKIRSCVSSSPPTCNLSVSGQYVVALAALDWYMDNSQANSLAAAKYWVNNAETTGVYTNTANSYLGYGCDYAVGTTDCGKGSYTDWASESLPQFAFAYSLIRSELSAGEKTAFAQKMLNDSTFDETGCTNQLEAIGTGTYTSGSTTLTGSGLSGLSAGQSVYIRPYGWSKVASVESDSSITLQSPFKVWSGTNLGSLTNAVVMRVNAWSSTTCGLTWMLKRARYSPSSVGGGKGTTGFSPAYVPAGTHVTPAATTFPVVSTSEFGTDYPYYLYNTRNEFMKVTGKTSNSFTVERAKLGTTAIDSWGGELLYRNNYGPDGSKVREWAHNLIHVKFHGYATIANALLDDSPTAAGKLLDESVGSFYTDLYPLLKSMWTGITQGGSTNYGQGRDLGTVMLLVQSMKNFSGSPDFDLSGGNWLKSHLYYNLYGTLPTDVSSTLPWGQPDIASSQNAYILAWGAYLKGLYGASANESKYWTYLVRNVMNVHNSTTMSSSGAYNLWVLTSLLYDGASDTGTDYRSLPPERAFNSVDSGADKGLNAWISRTGWSSASDTLVFQAAWSLAYTTDHLGNGAPGAYKIFKGGWLLSENGSGDTGENANTNMILFGGTASQGAVGSHTVRMPRAKAGTGWAYVQIDAQAAYTAATAVTRARRNLVHFKASGQPDYIVAYDTAATSAAKAIGQNLHYDKTAGQASSISDTLPNIVWTGPDRRVSTKVVLPSGTGAARTASSLTNSFREYLCASSDGTTCASVTSAAFLLVHKPSTSTSDTMPTVNALATIDSDFDGVEIADASAPSVAVFAKVADQNAGSFTTTLAGTAQVIVSGLVAGTYEVTQDGGAFLADQAVDANGVLAFTGTAGAYAITQTGTATAPTITTTTLSNGVLGQAYSATLAASDGALPLTWDVSAGSLCTGLTLSSAGVVSGTPTVAQTCSFTARVTDNLAQTDTQALSLTIQTPPPTLSVRATPGSDSVVLTFGTPGLSSSQSCDISLSAVSNVCVPAESAPCSVGAGSATSNSGASTRVLSVGSLTASTSHTAAITCGTVAAGSASFTTKATSGSGTYALRLKPTATTLARMTALDATLASAQALVYWQAPGEGSYTGTATACSSGCTVSKTSLASGVHSYYHEWIAGTAYATGAINWTNASYPSDGETVTVGSITYTFRDTVAQPFDVKIVPDSTEATYNNLWEAINYENWTPGVSPNAPGADYYATAKNPDVVRLTWSAPDNTATFRAAVLGSGGNAIPLSETSASMTVTPLSGGTDATIATSAARPAYVPIP